MTRKEPFDISLTALHEAFARHGILADYLPTVRAAPLSDFTTDSRAVRPGSIFIAYQGVSTDLHHFIDAAVEGGAACLVVERPPTAKLDIPVFIVKSGRAAWTLTSALAYGNPQEELSLIAVTGTNGKSSTVWMLRDLLKSEARKCLAIGTLGAFLGDEKIATSHTTPDPPELFRLMRLAVDRGIDVVAMEASSHALHQKKLNGLSFCAAAFTSFSQDHLDLHETMDDYFAAKWSLFERHLRDDGRAIFCNRLDDRLPESAPVKDAWRYGVGDFAFRAGYASFHVDVKAVIDAKAELVLRARDSSNGATAPFFAEFYLENLAAAVLCADRVLGRLPQRHSIERLSQVPGRLQRISTGQAGEPLVFVDYAHTPDALEKALVTLRPLSKGKLRVVFGCGGDRDRGKRPLMGALADRLADETVLTSDNPRSEDAAAILDEIAEGIESTGYMKEPDREKAIGASIAAAGPGDIVLIAGKGHEKYQIIGKDVRPFDDCEVARLALERKRHGA